MRRAAILATFLSTLWPAQATLGAGHAAAVSQQIEQLRLDSSLTPVSLLGDGVTDAIVAVGEPPAGGYSPGRLEVLADSSRLRGPAVRVPDWRRSDFEGVPILGVDGGATAPYFRTLVHAGCAHEFVTFYRKSVGGRSVALYAAQAFLDQNSFTTWDDDLDHATEKLTVYVLEITRRSAPGAAYGLAFAPIARTQTEIPTCDPRSFDATFIGLIHGNSDVTAYPSR